MYIKVLIANPEWNLILTEKLQDPVIPEQIGLPAGKKSFQRSTRSTEQCPVPKLDVQIESLNLLRKKRKIRDRDQCGNLIWRKLKNNAKAQRSMFPADNGAAQTAKLLPVGKTASGLRQQLLLGGIKIILAETAINGEGVKGGDRCLCQKKTVKNLSKKHFICKIFNITDIQCKHKYLSNHCRQVLMQNHQELFCRVPVIKT